MTFLTVHLFSISKQIVINMCTCIYLLDFNAIKNLNTLNCNHFQNDLD